MDWKRIGAVVGHLPYCKRDTRSCNPRQMKQCTDSRTVWECWNVLWIFSLWWRHRLGRKMRVEIWRCQESWQVCSHSFDEVLYVLERLTLYIFSIPLHVDNKKLREIAGIADFKLRGHEDDERLTSILAICCVQAVIYIRDKDWKFLTIHSSVEFPYILAAAEDAAVV
jgi:hypothetical protein